MKIKIASNEIVHFVGIGGIGMSGLAHIMKNMKFNVQGSDLNYNKNIERLNSNGIKVFIGHKKVNINKATMLVMSSAIGKKNVELLAAKKKKIPIFKRGEMLANIVTLKKNIVVAGSHGKTTTTSLISNILAEAGLDPTVINGGVINSLKNSAKLGKGEWAVIESDESDGSFLNLSITYSIITNIDKEHLDYYDSFNSLKQNFKKFLDKTPSFGKSLVCIDNRNLRKILEKNINKNILTYGFNKDSNFQIINARKKKLYSKFDLKIKIAGKAIKIIKNIQINLLGDHNISNATASIAIALNLGVNIKIIKKTLKKFTGIQRRFTKVFSSAGKDFYDDYAHHPTEITAVLNGAREVNKKRRIICVFQPHRYSRIRLLEKEFASSFKKSDLLVLCPMYSAGERKKYNFDQQKFSELISKKSNIQVININNQKDLSNFFKRNLFDNEMIICMGAGSISSWLRSISKEL